MSVCLFVSVIVFTFIFLSLWVLSLYLYLRFSSLCLSSFVLLSVFLHVCVFVCLFKRLYFTFSLFYYRYLAYLVRASVSVPASACVFMACVHADVSC